MRTPKFTSVLRFLICMVIAFGALLAITSLSGCGKGKTPTPPPPGALNAADAASYTFLRTIDGAIKGFKSQYDGLPADWKSEIKGPLNKLIASYDIAQAAWHAQHAAGTGDLTETNFAINQVLNDLASVNAAFTKLPAQKPTSFMVPHVLEREQPLDDLTQAIGN